MKYFVFFIGGTGARVLTSFLHISAAGMIRMEDPIHLMLLDADMENCACNDAMALYRIYRTNYEKVHTPEVNKVLAEKRFQAFYANLDLPNIVTPMNPKTATLDLATAGGEGSKALKWFYTEQERGQNLSNGFYAHPNIGCIYFQDLGNRLDTYTRQIRNALSKGEDVRVVITGSMFGGTGAAGIPSVLKLIQRACSDGNLSQVQINQHLHFGGVLVTPYFKVAEPGEGESNLRINSDVFFNNTQSALNYYGFRYANDFESIYLVGQNGLQLVNPVYEDGGTKQENKPHVVELIAALGIKDFLQQTESTGLQVFPQILDIEARNPVFSWDSLDSDLSDLGDMLRTQVLLKVVFGPYVERPRGFGKPGWYKAFRMDRPGRKEELQSLMQYTDIFLDWIYKIQYQLPDSGYGQLKRDDRIALLGPPIEEIMMSGDDLRQDYLYTHFAELLDDSANPQNISYYYSSAKHLVVDVGTLGTADSSMPSLGSLGLAIQLFNQASKKIV